MAWDTPPTLWMNGHLVPWTECRVHVTSAYAQRGASLFEGIRVYRTQAGKFLALAFDEHLNRLERSWRAFSLPVSWPGDLARTALSDLLKTREVGDCYCRITRFLDMPDSATGIEADGLMVALYQSSQLLRKPVSCVTSSWRRNEFALPAHSKIGGHYFLLSWVRQQARRSGADDAILLNEKGAVAEATGTGVLMFKGGTLVTPPIVDGALPSITIDIVERLASELGIPMERRSIPRSELFRSAGVFLAGTLDELRPVISIDGIDIPDALDCKPVAALFDAFSKICRIETEKRWGVLFPV